VRREEGKYRAFVQQISGRSSREASMLGIPLRYLLKHPVTGIADLAADPIGIWSTIREAYAERREEQKPQCTY
jgi:hypothetical protein